MSKDDIASSLHQEYISIFLIQEISISCWTNPYHIQELTSDAFHAICLSLNNEYNKCSYTNHETVRENAELIRPWYLIEIKRNNNKNIENTDTNSVETIGNEREIEYDIPEASSLVKCNDITVFRGNNNFHIIWWKIHSWWRIMPEIIMDKSFPKWIKLLHVIIMSILNKSQRATHITKGKYNRCNFLFQCCGYLPRIAQKWRDEVGKSWLMTIV